MQGPTETIARDTIAEVAEYLSKLDGTGLPEYPTAERIASWLSAVRNWPLASVSSAITPIRRETRTLSLP